VISEQFSVSGAVTLALAIFGALLGVITTCIGLNRSRLKLRVLPAHAISLGAADKNINFSIEVTNLSDFAVYVGLGIEAIDS
jgi:hypothetical protein